MGEYRALFPAVVAATPLGLDADTRDQIANYVTANKDCFKKRRRDGVIFEESLINLHNIPLMRPMFKNIVKAVAAALKGMGTDPNYFNLQITRSWANYNVKSSVTASHTHINSHVSVVYYPDESCNQASINFMNFSKQNQWIPGIADPAYAKIGVFDRQNHYGTDVVSYTPEADMCFIFPSDMVHSVSPNPSYRPRISVAMDTLFTLKEYARDEALLPPPRDWKEFEL